MKKETKKVHIGQLIKARMEEDGHSVRWLYRQIPCERSNIYNIYTRESINTKLLLDISLTLKTNFFKHFSEAYDDMMAKTGSHEGENDTKDAEQ